MKQIVILCAGRGSRLSPLTDEVPKVLVEVNGKSILEYKLEMLNGFVDEVILIVGYKGDKIREKIGDSYDGLKIRYCDQGEPLGSGHAIWSARDLLKGEFIVLNGDDFYSLDDLKRLACERFGILGFEVDDARTFGVLELNSDGDLENIEEKPSEPKSSLVNIGAYGFDVSVFDKEMEKGERGEYEIVDFLTYLLEKGERVRVLKTDYWVPVNDFEQLKEAEKVII